MASDGDAVSARPRARRFRNRWRRGDGLKLIGRVFGKTSTSIFAHLRPLRHPPTPGPHRSERLP